MAAPLSSREQTLQALQLASADNIEESDHDGRAFFYRLGDTGYLLHNGVANQHVRQRDDATPAHPQDPVATRRPLRN